MNSSNSRCIFEVHLEWFYHAILLPEFWPDSDARGLEETWKLLKLLSRHGVHATFYVLGQIAEMHPKLIQSIVALGHHLGNHGYWHRHGERHGDASYHLAAQMLFNASGVGGPYPYRSPFWDTTPCPGWSGGAYFRILPYPILKRNIKQTGVFWLHPHDLYRSNFLPLRRSVFLCNPWERLEQLLTEVEWKR